MDYNTQRKRMLIPEYGRIIQNMVDYALTIEDKEERQRCANTIVSIMGNMFPHLRDIPEFKHKLWDHLAVMSDYKLDIDYPYEITPKSNFTQKPTPLPYPMKKIHYRHYGYLLETLLKKLVDMPEGPERDELSMLAAGQMKRSLNDWNKDALDDEKIVADMTAYTNGAVHLDLERFKAFSAAVSRQNMLQISRGNNLRRNRKKG